MPSDRVPAATVPPPARVAKCAFERSSCGFSAGRIECDNLETRIHIYMHCIDQFFHIDTNGIDKFLRLETHFIDKLLHMDTHCIDRVPEIGHVSNRRESCIWAYIGPTKFQESVRTLSS